MTIFVNLFIICVIEKNYNNDTKYPMALNTIFSVVHSKGSLSWANGRTWIENELFNLWSVLLWKSSRPYIVFKFEMCTCSSI